MRGAAQSITSDRLDQGDLIREDMVDKEEFISNHTDLIISFARVWGTDLVWLCKLFVSYHHINTLRKNQRNIIRVPELLSIHSRNWWPRCSTMDTHFRVQYGQKHDKGGHFKMCSMKKTWLVCSTTLILEHFIGVRSQTTRHQYNYKFCQPSYK